MQPTQSFRSSIAIKRTLGLGTPKTLGQQTHKEMELSMKFSQKKRKGKIGDGLIFAIIGQTQGKGRKLVFPSTKHQVKTFLLTKSNENPSKMNQLFEFLIRISLNSIRFQSIIENGSLCKNLDEYSCPKFSPVE